MHHDLAILIMKTPFTFNEKIQPITLDFRPEYMNTLKGLYNKALKMANFGINLIKTLPLRQIF